MKLVKKVKQKAKKTKKVKNMDFQNIIVNTESRILKLSIIQIYKNIWRLLNG